MVDNHQERALVTFKACSESIAKESREIGYELLGLDFMVDTDLNVYLIEVNTNPCLSTLTASQDNLIKKLVDDVLKLTVDPIFGLHPEETTQLSSSPPAETSTNFELLYIYHSPQQQ